MQTVKLTSRREVAPAVYELLFTRPEGWTFEAGQFARIGLAADGDEPVFRAYSIAGSPKAEGLRFLVKSVEGGALSPRLCALNPGDEVLLDGEAQGNLLPARIPGGDTVWMLATGSGLAPFIAMTGDEGTLGAWKKHILVIGARTREESTAWPPTPRARLGFRSRSSRPPPAKRANSRGAFPRSSNRVPLKRRPVPLSRPNPPVCSCAATPTSSARPAPS
ncbi:MAG: FAD-binding oxidoreductase [Sutterella wadsworthensis]